MLTRFLSRVMSTSSVAASTSTASINVVSSVISSTGKNKPKPWRDAATLLLAAPTPGLANGDKSISFLTMERSKNSAFMGSSVCFPGGCLAPSDSSLKWLDIFRKFGGVDVSKLKFLTDGATRPLMYSESAGNFENSLPLEVSMRIAAIRETFEECGILLSTYKFKRDKNYEVLDDELDIRHWQKRVSDNPEEFLELFESIERAPDIQLLYEWSNWLTPPFENKRFDTMFFLAMMPKIREFYIDQHEVANARWATGQTLINEFSQGKIWLPTPQMYEMLGIQKAKQLQELKELAILRKKFGIERWIPQAFGCSEGVLLLLPGDGLFPKDDERDIYTNVKKMDVLENTTFAQLRAKTLKYHRVEYNLGSSTEKFKLMKNIPVRCGQLYLDINSSPTNSIDHMSVKSHL